MDRALYSISEIGKRSLSHRLTKCSPTLKNSIMLSSAILDLILWGPLLVLEIPISPCLQSLLLAVLLLFTGVLGCANYKNPTRSLSVAVAAFAAVATICSTFVFASMFNARVNTCRKFKCFSEMYLPKLAISFVAFYANVALLGTALYSGRPKRLELWTLTPNHDSGPLYPMLKSNVVLALSIVNLLILGFSLMLQFAPVAMEWTCCRKVWSGILNLLLGSVGCVASKHANRSLLNTVVILASASVLLDFWTNQDAFVSNIFCAECPLWPKLDFVLSQLQMLTNVALIGIVVLAMCSPASAVRTRWTPTAIQTRPISNAEASDLHRSGVSLHDCEKELELTVG